MSTYRIKLLVALCAMACSASFAARVSDPLPKSDVRPGDSRTTTTSTNRSGVRPDSNRSDATSDQIKPVSEQQVQKVEAFRGRRITGVDGTELGTVHDFIVDTESGNVVYTVVASPGNTLRLVQQSSLRVDGQGFKAELEQATFDAIAPVTREQLDADEFTPIPPHSVRISVAVSQQPAVPDPATTPAVDSIPESTGTSSVPPPAAAADGAVTSATTLPVEVTAGPSTGKRELDQRATHLVRASKLAGTEVRSDNRPLGAIEAIALDLDRGKATAVLELREAAGKETKFQVPLDKLKFASASKGGVSTSLTRSDFAQVQPTDRSPAASSSSDEVLTPTGRTESSEPDPRGAEKTDTPSPPRDPQTKADRSDSSAKGDPEAAATADTSDRSRDYNIHRAMSGRGVGGTPPEPARQPRK